MPINLAASDLLPPACFGASWISICFCGVWVFVVRVETVSGLTISGGRFFGMITLSLQWITA